MALMLLAAPAAEPITLADAKLYLRVEHNDDDALITTLVAATRQHVELQTRRAMIDQTWRLALDAWPRDGRIVLALAPVRSVVAARVFDGEGLAHDVDTQVFVVDATRSVLGFVSWAVPPPGREVAGIEIDMQFGYGAVGADVPEPLRQPIRLLLAHWYENRGLADDGARSGPAAVQALLAPYRVLTL